MKNTLNVISTRTSGFLKDPYRIHNRSLFYRLRNYIINYTELKNFEAYFSDFSRDNFPDQVKILYNEVINSIPRNDLAVLQRLVSPQFLENKIEVGKKKEYIFESQLYRDAKDFEIVHARTYYGGDILGELDNTYAQVIVKFSIERAISNGFSYLDWKIICFDYDNKI